MVAVRPAEVAERPVDALARRDPCECGQRALRSVGEESVHCLRAPLGGGRVEGGHEEVVGGVVVDARVLVPLLEQVVEDRALWEERVPLAEVAVSRVCDPVACGRVAHHMVRPARAREGRVPAVEDGELGGQRGTHREGAIRESLHHKIRPRLREWVQLSLIVKEAVHSRRAVYDVELVLVCGVAVDRMGGCHIRRAVEDLDAAEPRMCQRDWIALVSGEAIDLSDALVMAKEVVEGAVLLVEHDDVLDPRVCN